MHVRIVRWPPQDRMQERAVGPCFTAMCSTPTFARFMALAQKAPHSSWPRQPSSWVQEGGKRVGGKDHESAVTNGPRAECT